MRKLKTPKEIIKWVDENYKDGYDPEEQCIMYAQRDAEEVNAEYRSEGNKHAEGSFKRQMRDEKEISQLKKQLERAGLYSEKLVENLQNEIALARECINDLKSKLEVKEKPDFTDMRKKSLIEDNIGIGWLPTTSVAIEYGMEKVWDHFVIPRDAKIAELENIIEGLTKG